MSSAFILGEWSVTVSKKCGGATTILLICREGASREAYHAELALPGVLLVSLQSLMGFFQSEVYCPINGILVDMPTYMRCSEEEKRLLTELVGVFPALRLKCNEQTGEIRTLPFGTTYPGNAAPAVFVQTHCISFLQRRIRTCERSLLNMSALLRRSFPQDNNSGVRSVTAHISCNGCFLVCFEPWNIGEDGWLTLLGLQDNAPIPVEISSVSLWGEVRSLPGMGVKFIQLTNIQKRELGRLGGQNFMLD